ncbi:small multidrug efflux protein [Cryobacterium lactosi]|uniref:Small multidrug efflux protein n=1 Tax=Cryobacterium lactosi TaxID=1259202 RepID=A0A4R9BXN2_9MICO|nr:small multidrug efflux protein [Cryobacterium lactosi]TFD92071.1 small multidrug efflux protein [Cryobacterium lactosi]
MDNPYEWLRSAIEQVPDILQPLIVALAGAIPYIEGEGATAFGILAGINPVVAAIAGATGNILCVLVVVFLGSRIREGVVARRATKPVLVAAGGLDLPADAPDAATDTAAKPTGRAKGRARLRRWMVKFGVPGASILAPLALPTMLTAAFFVASGVPKGWVVMWQVIAIVLWTALIAIVASGALALLGW